MTAQQTTSPCGCIEEPGYVQACRMHWNRMQGSLWMRGWFGDWGCPEGHALNEARFWMMRVSV